VVRAAIVGWFAGAQVGTRVIDEPGHDPQDEDDATDDQKRNPDENAESEQHHAECDERWGEARLRDMDRMLFCTVMRGHPPED
jgi:hypothetical protein